MCIVASTGADVSQPSRNRTVLVGLVRDMENPLPTRFEIRAPNPHTNTYLALAAFYQAMMDGMSWAAGSGQSAAELQAGLFKASGAPHPYLERERAYRSEEDVFEHYDDRQRERLFGRPPATVWETLANLDALPEKTAALSADGVFAPELIASYRQAIAAALDHGALEPHRAGQREDRARLRAPGGGEPAGRGALAADRGAAP